MSSWLYFCRPSTLSFHNLCTSPSNFITPVTKSLLGLGLNFCVQPPLSNRPSDIDFTRLRRNAWTQMFFAGSDPLPKTKLFVPSKWSPSRDYIPAEFRVRFSEFEREATLLFRPRRCQPNLLPRQATVLAALRNNTQLHVWKTDKNLGPAIIERDEYIRRALKEHLLDVTTYRYLTKQEADNRIKAMKRMAANFETQFFPQPPKHVEESRSIKSQRTFLRRSRESAEDDPFGYFYLMAKIHKQPWTTRPIVSCSGCLFYGLGRWVDQELQKIVRQLPYVIRSSADLVRDLALLGPLPPSARFFTCDATAMYTNICTTHALQVINEWLSESPIPTQAGINVPALNAALRLVMTHNIFRFGDTFWVQLTGTAMGTPPSTHICYAVFLYTRGETYPFNASIKALWPSY